MAELKFPVYRKYLNDKNYFKIESMNSFEEIRSHGKKWLVEKHEVKILPDRNFVHDLVFDYENFAEKISGEVYDTIRKMTR